jgi:tetratricopeptide (TPR) repeat protein
MASDPKQIKQIEKWLGTGEAKRAENQIVRLLRADLPATDRAQLLLLRARARIVLARPDEALEDLQTMRALASELWSRTDVQELLGDAYFSRFELAPVGFAERPDAVRARAIYESIEINTPNYENMGWVLYQWGRVLLSENNVDEAIAKFTAALDKPSTVHRLRALIFERLGFVYLTEKRDPTTALSYFSRAAATYPASESTGWLMRLHMLRSRAYRELNMYDEALQAAQFAMMAVSQSEPDYRAAILDGHLSLGEILSSIPGREREAVEHLQQFLQQSRRPQGVDVTWSRIHETLGALYFRLERYEQAISAYRTALSFNPYHPWEIQLQYEIARSYYRLREYENTIANIQRMMTVAQEENQPITDYQVYALLANAHFALEQFPDAVSAFERAVELAPPDATDLEKYRTYLKAAEELIARH